MLVLMDLYLADLFQTIANSSGVNGLFTGLVAVSLAALRVANAPIKTIVITLALVIVAYLITIIIISSPPSTTSNYTINGKITDACGVNITFAKILVVDEKNDTVSHTGETNQDGRYSFAITIDKHSTKIRVRVDSSCGGRGLSDLVAPATTAINFSTEKCCNNSPEFTIEGVVRKESKLIQGALVYLYKGSKDDPNKLIDSVRTNHDGAYKFKQEFPLNSDVTIKVFDPDCPEKFQFNYITLAVENKLDFKKDFKLSNCPTPPIEPVTTPSNPTLPPPAQLLSTVLTLDQELTRNTTIYITNTRTGESLNYTNPSIRLTVDLEKGQTYNYTIKRGNTLLKQGSIQAGQNISISR